MHLNGVFSLFVFKPLLESPFSEDDIDTLVRYHRVPLIFAFHSQTTWSSNEGWSYTCQQMLLSKSPRKTKMFSTKYYDIQYTVHRIICCRLC